MSQSEKTARSDDGFNTKASANLADDPRLQEVLHNEELRMRLRDYPLTKLAESIERLVNSGLPTVMLPDEAERGIGFPSASGQGEAGSAVPAQGPPAPGAAAPRAAATAPHSAGRHGAEAPMDLSQLPNTDLFVDRVEDLEWILGHLSAGQRNQLAALEGMGGIGKTALAARAAQLLQNVRRFPDGLAVVLCQNISEPEEILRRVLARFDGHRQPLQTTSAAEVADMVSRVLFGKDALIVLDDIDATLDIERVITPLRTAGVAILLTARQKFPRSVIPADAIRTLELLGPHDATDLFIRSLSRTAKDSLSAGEQDAIQRIVESLGRHTLAVKLAASYAADAHRDVISLADELENPQNALSLPRDGSARSIALVFQESIDKLSAAGQLLFAGLAAFRQTSFGRKAVVFLGRGLGIENPDEVVDHLIRRAILEGETNARVARQADRERLSMHPLVGVIASILITTWSDDHRETAFRQIATYYATMIDDWDHVALDLVSAGLDEANILGALQWSYQQWTTENAEGHLLLSLCLGMRRYWRSRHRHQDDLLTYLQAAIEIAQTAAHDAISAGDREVSEAYERRVAVLTLTYGQMLRRDGKLDQAMALLTDSLQYWQQRQNRRREAFALYQLGHLSAAFGQLEDAERYFTQSRDIRHAVGDRRDEGANVGYLGRIALARGRLDMAEVYLNDSLKIAEEINDAVGIAAVLCSLGHTVLARGRLDDAEDYFKRSLRVLNQVSNPDRTTDALTGLGRVAYDRGSLDEAEQHFTEALRLDRQADHRLNEGIDLSLIAQIAVARGELQFAEHLLHESLAIRREVHDRRGEGVDIALLGYLSLLRGEQTEEPSAYEAASHQYEQALAIANEVDNRRGAGACYYYLGLLAERSGALDQAEDAYGRSLTYAHDVASAPDIARAQLALGQFLLRHRSNRKRGMQLIQEALKSSRELGRPVLTDAAQGAASQWHVESGKSPTLLGSRVIRWPFTKQS